MEVLAEVLPVKRRRPGRQRRARRIPGRQGQASHLWQGLELISTQPSTCSPRKLLIFIGCFLDRLYEVADLLIERPSPEPPDPTQALSRVRPAPLEGLLGRKLAWTRKWTFQLFVKKRRRKPDCHQYWETFPPKLATHVLLL